MLDVGAVVPEDAVISWVTILVIPHHLGNIDGHADIYETIRRILKRLRIVLPVYARVRRMVSGCGGG